MNPKEIIAESEEIKAMLRGFAATKIGFGMDKHFQRFLKIAYKFVNSHQDLARQVELLSVDAAKRNSEGNP